MRSVETLKCWLYKLTFPNGKLRADRSRPFECIETGQRFETFQEATTWLRSIGFVNMERARIVKALSVSACIYGYHFKHIEK